MTTNIKKLKIKSFESGMDMGSCLEFSEGYFKVLSDSGINNIPYLHNHSWLQTEGFYGVLAEHNGLVVGGLLLFIPIKQERFPFEDLFNVPLKGKKSKIIQTDINAGELFALWHSAEVAGWGLSYILLKAGLALAVKHGLDKIYFTTAEYNLRLTDKLGFQPELNNGLPVFYTFNGDGINTKIYLSYFTSIEQHFGSDQREEVKVIAKEKGFIKQESVLGKKLEVQYLI